MIKRALTILSIFAYMGLSMRNCLYAYNYQPLVLQWCHLENCTVVSNYNNGIALTTGRSSTVRIRNCVSYGNRYKSYASNVNGANSTGDFFYTKDWAKRTDITLMVTNSYIANGAAISIDNYQGGGTAIPLLSFDGSGASASITAAADAARGRLFVDAANRDWHLQAKSPLREAGVTFGWMTEPATDLDGKPRLTNAFGKPFATDALPDLGCYECQLRTFRGTAVLVQ